MNRKVWATGLVVLLGSLGAAEATNAADVDTARTIRRRPSAALLMRLAKARQLSTRPRTFQTQVGVAVALAILVERIFGDGQFGQAGDNLAAVVINVLLLTTIFTEIVGPLLTSWSITKAGEANVRSAS